VTEQRGAIRERQEAEEAERKAYLALSIMDHTTLGKWLIGELPKNCGQRPGELTGLELADILRATGVPYDERAHLNWRKKWVIDQIFGWRIKHYSSGGAFGQTEIRYLHPNGHTIVEVSTVTNPDSRTGISSSKKKLPASYVHALEDLSHARISLFGFDELPEPWRGNSEKHR
jgi:hypothetical protein